MPEPIFWAILATVAATTFAFGAFFACEAEKEYEETLRNLEAEKRKTTIENDKG